MPIANLDAAVVAMEIPLRSFRWTMVAPVGTPWSPYLLSIDGAMTVDPVVISGTFWKQFRDPSVVVVVVMMMFQRSMVKSGVTMAKMESSSSSSWQ